MSSNFRLPRFYPILDPSLFPLPLVAAEGLLSAGVRILQFRHKKHYSQEMFRTASQIAKMCHDTGALFVINDRADMARLLNAILHIGQDDLSPADARAFMGPKAVLGFSTHNETQLRAALNERVDYVALGPVFGTSSKLNPDPIVGVEELCRLRPLVDRPLVAIGGITRANAESVYNAGADSIAVIGDLLVNPPTSSAIEARAREWLQIAKESSPF
jgi:thiamine-phosphate pyrophosphorylase